MKLLLLLLFIINVLYAQKMALVIGNSDYTNGYLPNPTKDADLIAQSLRAVGFSVSIQKNLSTAPKMKKAINNFVRGLDKEDIAVIYYAGHGVQCKGKNYLMPTKADVVRGGQLASEALDLDFLIGGVSELKLAIVMLDACRNNTYPSCSKSQTRGLVQPNITDGGGMILSFATAPNKIALDGDGDHSPYAMALSKYMNQSMPIETYFRRVGGEVFGATGSQRPMLKNSFYGEFSFIEGKINPNITTIGNLMWENQNFTKMYKHTEAINYCNRLTLGGYEDWRLPSRKELSSLATIDIYHYDTYDNWEKWFNKNKHKRASNSKGESHFIRKEFLENMPQYSWFWTADKKKGSSGSFWIVRFGSGVDAWDDGGSTYFVRCVRQ